MHAPRLLLCLSLALLGAPVLSQEDGQSIRDLQVQEVMETLRDASVPEIWAAADKLAALGAPAKRAIQKGLREATVAGRLAGLKALVDLDSPTYAAEKLMEIAGDDEQKLDHRLVAIELVGLTEEPDVEDGLLELLVAYNPQLQLAAARALWALGTPQSHRAKVVLRELLKSADAELQAQGALALAEIGDDATPGVLDILRRLRRDPGVRGQLAQALYDKLQLRRALDSLEKKADARGAQVSKTWRHLDEMRAILDRAYDLKSNVDLDENALKARAARGLVDFPSDPHTIFLDPAQYKEFLHGSDGVDPSYAGIGAFIDTNTKDSFRILRPIFGGPAWHADIRGGDDIVAVNGDPTQGRTTTEIIKQVKGPPGTPVRLTIRRAGSPEPIIIEVIRAKIVLPTVFYRMLPGKIGYLNIAQYAQETGKEMNLALADLEKEGMRGLIVDVRDNPGGLLSTVKECLTPFLRSGEHICTIKGALYRPDKHSSGENPAIRTYPISVLVNERSASGAELMSGAMQHYSKTSGASTAKEPYLDALVLGQASFGKGTVQHTMPIRSWPGEPFEDTPRKNGYLDGREDFEDVNKNGRWDPGEPFVDTAMLNNRWDDAEPWEDKNGNGRWDPGEEFTDENRDGVWNPAEKFTDQNQNGEYDYGAALKLTVARYYLPDGRNFTRERKFQDGQYVYEGGVQPDIEVDAETMPLAHLVELREMQQSGKFADYVRSRWSEHKDTFRKLAWYDGRDPARYPDFDAFHETLRTNLTKQEVRRALRIEVRREVSNEQGKEILGDLSDDNVLRRGVHEVLKRLDLDPASIEEYKTLEDAAAKK